MAVDVLSMGQAELEALVEEAGIPRYRGRQLYQALWKQRIASYDELGVWPKDLRRRAQADWPFERLQVQTRQRARDGTEKLAVTLKDGELVEMVLLPHRYGWSVCVSTQVGCAMGCHFCASGLLGKTRNLSAGEIADQVALATSLLNERGDKVRRVDLMGIGEPLDNYAGTVGSLRLMHDPDGLGLSYRHLTVSTSGLVPRIEKLADEGMPVTLAVSLHAPNDAVRGQLMPVNRAYPVARLMDALQLYWQKTRRRVTYEYLLIDGVNDGVPLAHELVRLIRRFPCHVNLIPWNPVPEFPYRPSPRAQVELFREVLEQAGISCTVRRELGQEIEAACGQLRRGAEART
ncbi:MAG: 23S rRNA (adenine(2503)-C(2))-methyltransferase RlmN [Clostridia bacterium]